MRSFQAVFYCFILAAVMLTCTSVQSLAENVIKDDADGLPCFQEARRLLASIGVTIPREILLKVRPREEVQVQYISTGGRSIQVGGYYQPCDPEQIWIIAGQSRIGTIADMAHELAHAWQSTYAPSQDRTITEGFAMWCEYKVLFLLGAKEKAASLLRLDDEDYGKGLKLFLSIESKSGSSGVIEYAKTATKP
ncbi:MAG: hypothetical protein AB9903_08870 [Vulcanimicrobiota bacterium]